MNANLTFIDHEHSAQVHSAYQLLPAWFTSRMMTDQWHFGLMLISGITIGISHIDSVSIDAAGHLWLDCEMLADNPGQAVGIKLLKAPCPERKRVSVNASQ